MNSISWTLYGLKKNPFDTAPLVEGGDISIDKAFTGRVHERNVIDSIISSYEQACIIIEGKVGVGKTSLASFEKVIWKSGKKNKKLFSFRGELEASMRSLNKQTFLLEVIHALLREIELVDPEMIQNNPFLQELSQIVMTTLAATTTTSGTVSGSLPFIGSAITHETSHVRVTPMIVTDAFLEIHFEKLIHIIRTQKIAGNNHDGLIIHMNNFDVIMQDQSDKKKVISFFQEMRDVFQTKHCIFIFLGPHGFYQDIIARHARVKAIFSPPLILRSLSKTEIIWTVKERLQILRSENVSRVIEPVTDEVISYLYDLFEGDLRAIFRGVSDILSQSGQLVSTKTLVEAQMLLAKERLAKIQPSLTKEQLQVLFTILEFDRPFTQTDITNRLQKSQTNLSGYYFSILKDLDVIEFVEKKDRFKYWQLSREYAPLKEFIQSKQTQTDKIDNENQISLF